MDGARHHTRLLLPGLLCILALLFGSAAAGRQRPREPGPREAPPGGVLPPTLQRLRVAVLRRPGCQEYEKVVEEFRDRVQAGVRLFPTSPGAGDRPLRRINPHLVFAVGQSAYDQLKDSQLQPLIYALVFHDIVDRAGHIAIPARVPPEDVLAALRLALPGQSHVAVLHGPRSTQAMDDALRAARKLGYTLHPMSAASPARAIIILRHMSRRARALWLLTDLDILTPQVVQYAIGIQFRRRVVLLGATRRHVEQGALMALDFEPHSLGREAADIANRTLAGAHADKVTVTAGTPTRLTVNRGTARTLGIPLERLRAAAAELVH